MLQFRFINIFINILIIVMTDFGFIITRHVNSFHTNKYWNHCIKLLRMYYPLKNEIQDYMRINGDPEELGSWNKGLGPLRM